MLKDTVVLPKQPGVSMGIVLDAAMVLRNVAPGSPAASSGLSAFLGRRLLNVNGATRPADVQAATLDSSSVLMVFAPAGEPAEQPVVTEPAADWQPGPYRIATAQAAVGLGPALNSPVIGTIPEGADVMVEEAVKVERDGRVRGRLSAPFKQGWVSLSNLRTGEMLVEAGVGGSAPPAPSQPPPPAQPQPPPPPPPPAAQPAADRAAALPPLVPVQDPASHLRRFSPIPAIGPRTRLVGSKCSTLYCVRTGRQKASGSSKPKATLLVVQEVVTFLCTPAGKVLQSFPIGFIDRVEYKSGSGGGSGEVLLKMDRESGEPDVLLSLTPSEFDAPGSSLAELVDVLRYLTWKRYGRELKVVQESGPSDLSTRASSRRGPSYRTPIQKLKEWRVNPQGSPFRQHPDRGGVLPPALPTFEVTPAEEPQPPVREEVAPQPGSEAGDALDRCLQRTASTGTEISLTRERDEASWGAVFDADMVLHRVKSGSPAERAGMGRFVGRAISMAQGSPVAEPQALLAATTGVEHVSFRFAKGRGQSVSPPEAPPQCDASAQTGSQDSPPVPTPPPQPQLLHRGDSDAAEAVPQTLQLSLHVNFVQQSQQSRKPWRSSSLLFSADGFEDASSTGYLQPIEYPPTAFHLGPSPPRLLHSQEHQGRLWTEPVWSGRRL